MSYRLKTNEQITKLFDDEQEKREQAKARLKYLIENDIDKLGKMIAEYYRK